MRRFECAGWRSNRFWEIEHSGTWFTVRRGRICSDGQTQTKSFPTEERARLEHPCDGFQSRPGALALAQTASSGRLLAALALLSLLAAGCGGAQAHGVDAGTQPDRSGRPDGAGPPPPVPGLVIACFAPRVVLGVGEDAQVRYGDFDFDMLRRVVEAGVNLVDASWIIEDMSKDAEERQRLRRRFVTEVKQYGIRYGHSIPLQGEPVEDGSFIGGASFLDEPLVYFPNEQTGDLPDPATASAKYVEFVQSFLDLERKVRPEDKLPGSFNITPGIAWYDMKAGARGSWFEILTTYYMAEVAFFNFTFQLGIPETLDSFLDLAAASARGAGRNFAQPWGAGIFAGTPEAERERILTGLYDRGARNFYLWAFHVDGPIPPESALSLARALLDHARQSPSAGVVASTALVLPPDFYLPAGQYCRKQIVGTGKCAAEGYKTAGLWNVFLLDDKDPAAVSLRPVFQRLGEEVKRLLASGEPFDILVGDDSLRPDELARYKQAIVIQPAAVRARRIKDR